MEEVLPYRKTGPEAVLRPTVSDARVFRPRLPGMLVPGEGAPHSDPQSREHHQVSAVNWPHLPRLSPLTPSLDCYVSDGGPTALRCFGDIS